ncbi:DUF4956 domain-containing protein [Verrucomicrobium sp. BvORR034]|uniref:DUF4956 domain-containing protein n=1 Tax=Verrucomicrobium sp. BvORR034 TaxID=1396418 RepID=UPI000678B0D5|nr:DUF4956 domain-containing protein [Verrucomicrobium sp. BvORR034]
MTIEELKRAAGVVMFGGDVREVADLGLATLSLSLAASLASSILLSWAYSAFFGSRATGSNVHRAFPLISLAVTAIFICVQFSLPLSLGLLGSLSVVRFRTPIKEPEEIGFIMLVIASALCCASFNVAFLIAILVAAGVAMAILRWSPAFLSRRSGSGTLVIRCSVDQYRNALPALVPIIEAHLRRPSFDSLSTADSECVLTWSFQKVSLVKSAELERKLQEQLPDAKLGLYYHGHANA